MPVEGESGVLSAERSIYLWGETAKKVVQNSINFGFCRHIEFFLLLIAIMLPGYR